MAEETAIVTEQNDRPSVKDLAKNLDAFFGSSGSIGQGARNVDIGGVSDKPMPKKLRKISGLAIPMFPPPPRQNTGDSAPSLSNKDSSDTFLSTTEFNKTFSSSGTLDDVMDSRKSFPKQRVDDSKVSQTVDKMKNLLDTNLAPHMKLKAKMKKTLFKLRGGFTAKLGDDEVVFRRVDGFWGKYKAIIESDYPKQMTYASMLGTVLLVIVEARQTCLDVHEFGKRMGESSKTIMKSEVVVNLLDTLSKLEAILDETLYFVGHSLASEVSSKAFATVKNTDLEEYLCQKRQVALPPMVDAPLLLLRDRLDPGDTEAASKLLPGLKKIEATAKSFYNQGYDHGVILLFVGETTGKACWEAATDSGLRKKIFGTLLQVFSASRANAWALIRDQSGLDLSLTYSVPE